MNQKLFARSDLFKFGFTGLLSLFFPDYTIDFRIPVSPPLFIINKIRALVR